MNYLDLIEDVSPEKREKIRVPEHPAVQEAQRPSNHLERLPSELEALIRAATNGKLPTGLTKLELGVCPDLTAFVTIWGLVYLTGSPDALGHLWNAHRAWSKHLNLRLN